MFFPYLIAVSSSIGFSGASALMGSFNLARFVYDKMGYWVDLSWVDYFFCCCLWLGIYGEVFCFKVFSWDCGGLNISPLNFFSLSFELSYLSYFCLVCISILSSFLVIGYYFWNVSTFFFSYGFSIFPCDV